MPQNGRSSRQPAAVEPHVARRAAPSRTNAVLRLVGYQLIELGSWAVPYGGRNGIRYPIYGCGRRGRVNLNAVVSLLAQGKQPLVFEPRTSMCLVGYREISGEGM